MIQRRIITPLPIAEQPLSLCYTPGMNQLPSGLAECRSAPFLFAGCYTALDLKRHCKDPLLASQEPCSWEGMLCFAPCPCPPQVNTKGEGYSLGGELKHPSQMSLEGLCKSFGNCAYKPGKGRSSEGFQRLEVGSVSLAQEQGQFFCHIIEKCSQDWDHPYRWEDLNPNSQSKGRMAGGWINPPLLQWPGLQIQSQRRHHSFSCPRTCIPTQHLHVKMRRKSHQVSVTLTTRYLGEK